MVSADFGSDRATNPDVPGFEESLAKSDRGRRSETGLSLHVCGIDNLFALTNNGGYALLALHFVQYVLSRSSRKH
jgi:hypothetical protein